MDNALSIHLQKIFSDSTNGMKQTQKCATDVVAHFRVYCSLEWCIKGFFALKLKLLYLN